MYPVLPRQSSADRGFPALLEPALPLAGDGLNVCTGVNIDPWLGSTLTREWLGTVPQTAVSVPGP